MKKTILSLTVIICTIQLSSANVFEKIYTTDKAILTNGAGLQKCDNCLNGEIINNLGGPDNGTAEFLVEVEENGSYIIEISYISGDPRSFFITINDNYKIDTKPKTTGNWIDIGIIEIRAELSRGINRIKFSNDFQWAPNIDLIRVIKPESYNISGIVYIDDKPAENIAVKIIGGTKQIIKTNHNGSFEFSNIPGRRNYYIQSPDNDILFDPYNSFFSELDSNINDIKLIGKSRQERSYALEFGSRGIIRYDLQNGLVNILYDGNKILYDGFSEYKLEEDTIRSIDYSKRNINITDFNDRLGTGKYMEIVHNDENLPELTQIFYSYNDKEYFFSEVILKEYGLQTNYIAPLVSNRIDVKSKNYSRGIFVPYDNDTFTRYQSVPFNNYNTLLSSEVTALYDNISRNGIVVGSVEQTYWKTGIKISGQGSLLTGFSIWGGFTDVVITRDKIPHGYISGNIIKSPRIFYGYFMDWRKGLEKYGDAVAIGNPRYIFDWEDNTPFGWNSWGSIQSGLNLENSLAVVDFFKNEIPDFRNDGVAYIDLDSYWDNMIVGGLEGDFSQLEYFVKYCRERNLEPGIYWAPFVDWGKTDRRVEGSNYYYSDAWTKVDGGYHDLDGTRAMDPTHPATLQRIDLVIDKYKDLGFTFIKIDFIGHASIEADSFYDSEIKTGYQAFRAGMEYLTDRLNDKMFVYVAISPSILTGPFAHSRRIACDAYSDIASTEYTLNSTTYGWWQGNIYNFIDADHLTFHGASKAENRARFLSGIINGSMILGDDFSVRSDWTNEIVDMIQNPEILDIVRDGKPFRPVEGDSRASNLFTRQKNGNFFIAAINFGGPSKYNVNLERLNIPKGEYSVEELFSGEKFMIQDNNININLDKGDAAVFRLEKK